MYLPKQDCATKVIIVNNPIMEDRKTLIYLVSAINLFLIAIALESPMSWSLIFAVTFALLALGLLLQPFTAKLKKRIVNKGD